MSYDGFYINLDRSTERRAQIEAELQNHNLGARYRRFRAADGNVLGIASPLGGGVTGCWTSHYQILKENRGRDQHLHIVEDDAVFASSTGQVIDWAISSGYLDRCDILFTDVTVPLLNDAYKTYKAFYDKAVTRGDDGAIKHVAFQVIDMAKISYASMTSYLINKASIAKLCDLYDKEISAGLKMPIDLFIRAQNHKGALKVGCIFPFVTSLRLERGLRSDINPDEDRSGMVAQGIGRYAFFVGCDWDLVRSYVGRYVVPPKDRLTGLLGELLTHSLSDAYRFY